MDSGTVSLGIVADGDELRERHIVADNSFRIHNHTVRVSEVKSVAHAGGMGNLKTMPTCISEHSVAKISVDYFAE